jgi:amino acid adenylation domain-containing protein
MIFPRAASAVIGLRTTLFSGRIPYSKPAVLSPILCQMNGAQLVDINSDPPANTRTPADAGPASLLQTQIWLQDQIAAQTGAYNIPTALRLRGPLKLPALRLSLDEIAARHESLRTRFVQSESGPRQIIDPPAPVELRTHSLIHLTPAERESALRSQLRAFSRQPFDLARDSMLRADLFNLGPDDHVLLVTMHHIASDGWSTSIFLRELKELYQANLSGSSAALPEIPIQYADYAAWQREQFLAGFFQDQLDWWKRELSGALPPLDLPFDRPRSGECQFEGEREQLVFPPALNAAVQQAARQFRVTEFTILYSAFFVLLARYCNQTELVTGTVVSGRTRVELEPIIGFLVNLLIIRAELPADISSSALFAQVQKKLLGAFARQDVPFDQVVAALNRPATEPVQAVFALENALLETESWGSLTVEWLDVHTGTAKFDLNLTIHQSNSGFSAVAEYRTALFEAATVQRLLRHYLRLLESMLAGPQEPVWKLPILAREEYSQVIDLWNATQTPYPRDRTIDELFRAQALASPRAKALVFDSETLTYAELDRRAEALAAHLTGFGAGPGKFVALCLDRSLDLIVSILAIIKSGAAYVPLDADYPAERLELLLRDCGASILLTHQHHSSRLPRAGLRLIEVDRPDNRRLFDSRAPRPPVAVSPESPANIIYTSGSTGVPKGVVVPHRAVVRLVKDTHFADLGPDQTFLQFAAISFDASTLEIWGPLLNGGRLCVAPPGRISLEDLAGIIRRHRISTLWLTSALFNLMVEEQIDSLKSLRQLLTGGDAASFSHFSRFHSAVPSCRLINGYGPTENTTFTACKTIDADTLRQGFIPIGKPISNTQVYILDRFLQPVPIGVVGELFTSGDGLALEYLNAPELTAQKFLPHPFRTGQKIYRAGDLARFLPNGDIQFLGRSDHQVKIRGFRIELGEIEHTLRLHPSVRDVCVLASSENAASSADRQLLCFWIPQLPAADSESLRLFLKQKLPDYLIPSRFISVDQFPVNASGKVDRKTLAALADRGSQRPSAVTSEQTTELEETLLKIWRDVLKTPSIGLHEDFFQLGGHSLLATQVISRIKQQLNLTVPLRFMFDHSTVAELAIAARNLQSRG